METTAINTYPAAGLCGICYRELPATIEYRSDGAAYIVKNCPVHGKEEAMIERDWRFLDEKLYSSHPNNAFFSRYNRDSVIEATDRCNVQCEHCYHEPDNEISDKPLDWVVEMARGTHTQNICLMGAEPTMRKDLPELIRRIKQIPWGDQFRKVAIYTNGVKLQNAEYVQELVASGLDIVNFSIHHPEYHDEKVWRASSVALQNICNSGITLGQVSFTVTTKHQAAYAIDKMLWLAENQVRFHDICIRSPQHIGRQFEQEEEIFVSDLYRWLEEIAAEKQLSFEFAPDENGDHHVVVYINGHSVLLIHWASVHSINTSKMVTGPWAHFVPNTTGTFMLQAILREGWKKGWWQGQRLVDEPASVVWVAGSTKNQDATSVE
jgi:organic radical activating enzyme